MKKLEDIPKKSIYEVPEGYFDRLPGIIQARVAAEKPIKEARPYFRYALQYALPAVVLMVVSVILLRQPSPSSAEELLASVSTEELASYLEESELSTEELLESVEFDEATVDAIEQEVYFSLPLEEISEDIDLDNL